MTARSAGRLASVLGLVATSAMTAGCAARFAPVRESNVPLVEPTAVSIDRIELGYSNMFLLRGATSGLVLVDAGSPSDVERTVNALAAIGKTPSDVKAVVLTHGHGDHAGMGSFFQKAGAKIIVGRGDELQTTAGKNDEMPPTGLFARALKPFVKLDYEPFTPDVLVDDTLDLAPWGLPGVIVTHVPGHTRGSLVVRPRAREAIVGDMILGGMWGGMFHGRAAGDHYYQLDPARNRCNVQALLDDGVETFHIGHGGPVTRDSVLQWSESWDRDEMTKCRGPQASVSRN